MWWFYPSNGRYCVGFSSGENSSDVIYEFPDITSAELKVNFLNGGLGIDPATVSDAVRAVSHKFHD